MVYRIKTFYPILAVEPKLAISDGAIQQTKKCVKYMC